MDSAEEQRLRLPSVARSAVAALNQLHAPRQPLEFILAGLSVRLAFASASDLEILEPRLVSLEFAGRSILLRCPAEALSIVLRALDPAFTNKALPSDDLLALLLQLAAEPWPVEVRLVSPDQGKLADAHALLLHEGGRTWPAELSGDVSAWPKALGLSPTALALALPAAIRLGATRLAASMVASLAKGDVVLIGTWDNSHQAARLVVADSWLAEVARTGDAWQLTQAPHPAAMGEKDWLMAEEEGGTGAARPEDIPVVLAFEVGRTEVTVGDISRLGPGSILELGRGPAELVEIQANGRRIGRGELVEIDGAVGVRIVRLFDAG